MTHQLQTFEVGVDDVGTSTLNVAVQISDLGVISVIIGLVYYFVTAFHGSEFSNAQIFFKPFKALQVFFQTLYKVIGKSFLASVPTIMQIETMVNILTIQSLAW